MNEEVNEVYNFPKIEELKKWLASIIYPGNLQDFVMLQEIQNDENTKTLKSTFYTENHQYFIVGVDKINEDGYLGCQVTCRKTRAGEDWFRGNDLPDGKFNKQTWDLILQSIICYEIVILSTHTRPKEVIENGNDIRKR